MSFTREKRKAIKRYMLDKIANSQSDIIEKTVNTFGITPNTVYRYLRELASDDAISKNGRKYTLKKNIHAYKLSIQDLPKDSEDTIYKQYVEPYVQGFDDNIIHMWYYCFTEMINNVLDHSEASKVTIYIAQDYMYTTIIIDDNGIGIFNKIKSYYHFPTIEDAIMELFKGKLTTDKAHHSGEGIFFSSRIMDVFAAVSSEKIFSHTEFNDLVEDLKEYPALNSSEQYKVGTVILMKLSNHSNKSTGEIMDQYANVDGGFIRTIIPIKNIYPDYPVSRSQAKRLTHRFDAFQEIQLDFNGVSEIGQGFAHEIFVVFQKQHPEVQLIPINANASIQKMIHHVTN